MAMEPYYKRAEGRVIALAMCCVLACAKAYGLSLAEFEGVLRVLHREFTR